MSTAYRHRQRHTLSRVYVPPPRPDTTQQDRAGIGAIALPLGLVMAALVLVALLGAAGVVP